ncbi:MAG TPA: hypothetical protein VD838_23175, partial [Anaeromyxobacteraceae bacterium]|nr:hypothetical protein [Anaeromyxobacteraceae bacterium]
MRAADALHVAGVALRRLLLGRAERALRAHRERRRDEEHALLPHHGQRRVVGLEAVLDRRHPGPRRGPGAGDGLGVRRDLQPRAAGLLHHEPQVLLRVRVALRVDHHLHEVRAVVRVLADRLPELVPPVRERVLRQREPLGRDP